MDNQKPTQNPQSNPDENTQKAQNSVPISPHADLPPLPPAFSSPTTVGQNNTETSASEETSTKDDSTQPEKLKAILSSPKKKFGGGKIIATILGILVLVGGVSAGVLVTRQKQVPQKAMDCGVNSCVTDKGTCGYWCTGSCLNACIDQSLIPSTGCTGYVLAQCGSVDQGGGSGSSGDCDNNGCEASGDNCLINRYECDDIARPCAGSAVESATSGRINLNSTKNCGSQQVDIECNIGTDKYTQDSVSRIYNTACTTTSTNPPASIPPSIPPSTSTPIPTPTPVAPFCAAITVYSDAWVKLDKTVDLPNLKAGDSINFCVTGAAQSGTFDKARFTINGSLMPETTSPRPGSSDLCQSYTIPDGTSSFNVTGEIHHTSGLWF